VLHSQPSYELSARNQSDVEQDCDVGEAIPSHVAVRRFVVATTMWRVRELQGIHPRLHHRVAERDTERVSELISYLSHQMDVTGLLIGNEAEGVRSFDTRSEGA